MVAVRSAHLTPAGEFAPENWVNGLGLGNKQSEEKLIHTWQYCHDKLAGQEKAPLLLWRGIEMTEILSTLSMDIGSLQAALLFPLVEEGELKEQDVIDEFGNSINELVKGVLEMDAIRQLKATQSSETSSIQVDNIRRMLLSMVEDFRCVVIKLAERIAHLREVKDATEDERVLAAKECSNIYAPLANRLGIVSAKMGTRRFLFPLFAP